jgi:hypothetical protein
VRAENAEGAERLDGASPSDLVAGVGGRGLWLDWRG